MVGARNKLRLVRKLVEARTCLRKSERKLRRQRSRVVASKSDQKLAKDQFTSTCRDLFRSRNWLNKIGRSNKEVLDQLIARKSNQKLAEYQFTSACRELKRSQNRLNKIVGVKRSNKEAHRSDFVRPLDPSDFVEPIP